MSEMRFAYADPPYVGQARKHYAHEAAARGRVAEEVDHPALIEQLVGEFPDGWALSCKSNSLRDLLPLCPLGVRVLAWGKPFAMMKKNVFPVYAWEPVLLCGGRRRANSSVKDWHVSSRSNTQPDKTNTAKGAKPPEFCTWLLLCLGFQRGDEMCDMFPGTGTMALAVATYTRQLRIAL